MKILLGVLSILLVVTINPLDWYKEEANVITKSAELLAYNTEDYIYLSDIPYIKEDSYANSGIILDKNKDKDMIGLKVNNNTKYFMKGITAWANSEVVYDLTNYNYDYFTSYLGVDISEQSNYFNTGVKFYIYTSQNKESWDKVYESKTLAGYDESEFVKIDIKNAKYLKLVADDNSEDWWSSWYDEAVYANAKLIKEGYQEEAVLDEIKTVAEYDAIIHGYYGNTIESDYEETLLKREFVNNIGYEKIKAFASYSDDYKETLLWLVNDIENLKLYLLGGRPDGQYINSLKVLADLYTTYQDDLTNNNMISNIPLKEIYKKMMISLSLTHSTTVGLWVTGRSENVNDPNESNAIVRYRIYKELLDEGKLDTDIFINLSVEEMRFVMNNIIDDEEIKWLNDYVRDKNSRDPYTYIKYTFDYNYFQSKYYDPAEYATWDAKYNLSKYNITYKEGYPKLFVVFEEGGVCGALSKTGAIIWSSNGVPSSVVSQPGHAAYIVYSRNDIGQGTWTIYNNISGWAQSGKTEKLNVRMPNGWGSGSYASTWPASYVLLAQAALNEFDKYEEAEKILMLANVYSNDNQKLEEIYRAALEKEKINLDAWLGLVNVYKNTNKDEATFYHLAEEIASTLRYYPLPMYDLLRMIEPHMTSSEYIVKFNLLKQNNLTLAANATNNESIQASAVREVANYLLGNIDTEIASFSFDGDNAGQIVLSSRFDDLGVTWEYSLDGKKTWHQTSLHAFQLTDDEIASITAENDISVHIVGADYSDANIYTIDIGTGTMPNNLYNNDLENSVIGITNTMEWRFHSNDAWTNFKVATPDLSGDKTVYVRVGATGVNLPSPEKSYRFTTDTDTDTRKYIPIKHLSIDEVSSEATGNNGHAINAIDGNIHTMWHSSYDGSDTSRYIIIELDEERYLSALEYVPRQSGSNGRIQNAEVYVSMDKNDWTKIGDSYHFDNSASKKSIEFPESTKAKYIKLVATSNYGDGRSFISAAMINLFEDINKKEIPTAEIKYSIEVLTNQNVTVKLINPSKNITITNNDGSDEYTFQENGKFTFEFIDDYGNMGSATAEVTWIDKIAPVATIQYSETNQTTNSVVATLTNASENIKILNNGGSPTYEFIENGSFEFIYQDDAGNISKTTAMVDWIVADKIEDNNQIKDNDSTENPPILDNDSNEEYRSFRNGNITLKIPANLIEENVVLKVEQLELNDHLKKQVSSNSKYFKIYLEKDGKEININGKMKMIISIDATQNFLGVYQLNQSTNLEKLDYIKLDASDIEIEIEKLGEYVLSYDDEQTSNIEDPVNTVKEEPNNNWLIWIGSSILGLCMIIVIVFYAKKKNNYK